MSVPAETGDKEDLIEAFGLFAHRAETLVSAYDALRTQVEELDQRVRAELRQREQLLNLLPGAVVVLDADGRVESLNDRAQGLFHLHPDGLQRWANISDLLLEGTEEANEYVISGRAGPRRFALTERSRPHPGGKVLLFTDVTESRARDAERRRRERLVEMGRVTANLAHQLRTPLAAAILHISQLNSGIAPPTRHAEHLGAALERLHRLEHLIRDTLRYARLPDDREHFVSAASLRALLERIYTPLYRQKTVTLGFQWSENRTLPGSLPGWEAVLGNLLANALHFTPAGGAVNVALEPHDGECRIAVEDSGPGLDPEALDRVFEPFFTTRPDGAGLGLSVAKDYINGLGGRISARACSSGGCRMEIVVPVVGTTLASP